MEEPGAVVVLRAEETTPWPMCRAVIAAADERGSRLAVSYAPPAGLRDEQEMHLPRHAAGTPVTDVDVTEMPDGSCALARPELAKRDAALRLRIPADLTAGPVLRLVAQLRVRGVYVTFAD